MRLTDIDFGGALPIDGYGPGFFRLRGEVHMGAVALLPGGVVTAWNDWTDMSVFVERASEIDVVFIGTGAEIAPLAAPSRAVLEAAGIGVELMATPSACRTYNMLLAEGRRIAAGLLPV